MTRTASHKTPLFGSDKFTIGYWILWYYYYYCKISWWRTIFIYKHVGVSETKKNVRYFDDIWLEASAKFTVYVMCFKRLKAAVQLLMCSMAVSDTGVIIIAWLQFAVGSLYYGWPFGAFMCRFLTYIEAILGDSSLWNITIVSIDRLAHHSSDSSLWQMQLFINIWSSAIPDSSCHAKPYQWIGMQGFWITRRSHNNSIKYNAFPRILMTNLNDCAIFDNTDPV